MPVDEFRVIGPPGCGKTTWLADQVSQAATSRGSDSVLITSLTRAAAAEVAGRKLPIPREHVGTLHAHAYQALGHPKVFANEVIDEWNKDHREYQLTVDDADLDEANVDGRRVTGQSGDDAYTDYTLRRQRMIDRDEWPVQTREFGKVFDDWKSDHEVLDFTDLIERATLDTEAADSSPSVIFADETQDYSKLEMGLLRRWSRTEVGVERLVIVGDPDQCQPGETLVLTTQGEKRLDAIDPETDRLISFDRRGSVMLGFRNGYAFRKAMRSYNGDLTTVGAGDKKTRCTHDHRWLVRWLDKSTQTTVVYMMRRGDRWRVGWCQLFAKEGGTLHLGVRARLEGADETWILKAFDTRAEASQYENYVAILYGLPLITFAPRGGKGYTSQIDIDAVYDKLNSEDQEQRAHTCLWMHDRDFRQPLINKAERHAKQGKRAPWVVRACNLMPGLMGVPLPRADRGVAWEPVTVSRDPVADFPVYSLDVPPYHNYVADGIVTMNNLYEWRGSDPVAFQEPPVDAAHRRVLKQSYRVPRAVHAAAVDWIRKSYDRPDIEYLPRDFEGSVAYQDKFTWKYTPWLLDSVMTDLKTDRTVMLLTSCSYMLGPVLNALRSAGIPFWNPRRLSRGDWNPLRYGAGAAVSRLLAYLRPDDAVWGAESRDWTTEDVRAWSGALKDVLKRRSSPDTPGTFHGYADGTPMTLEALAEIFRKPEEVAETMNFMAGDFSWYESHLSAAFRTSMSYPIQIAKKRGGVTLRKQPQVVVGTVHSVKGFEASKVYLFPDLSAAGYAQWTTAAGHNAVRRQFYVGMTRAKEDLVLCGAATPLSVRW